MTLHYCDYESLYVYLFSRISYDAFDDLCDDYCYLFWTMKWTRVYVICEKNLLAILSHCYFEMISLNFVIVCNKALVPNMISVSCDSSVSKICCSNKKCIVVFSFYCYSKGYILVDLSFGCHLVKYWTVSDIEWATLKKTSFRKQPKTIERVSADVFS